jgi:DNA-binding YbaB/EbfC family protein
MKDLMGMMKGIGEMKAKMEAAQAEIANLTVEGRSGGGLVTVTMTGKGDMKGLQIDPSLFRDDDVDVLEDLIIAAHADAKAKAEAEVARRMQDVTAGLPIPPGMKLPF